MIVVDAFTFRLYKGDFLAKRGPGEASKRPGYSAHIFGMILNEAF